MKKRDFILMASIVLFAVILLLILCFREKGCKVKICIDGQVVNELPLDKNISYELPLKGEEKNTVVIENGEVYMQSANCPDKLCVRMGKIHRVGESIICLPHKAYVEIIGDENEIDGVVR